MLILLNLPIQVMESLTKTITLQIYRVDLSDLPSERLSEQKRKRLIGKLQTNGKGRANPTLKNAIHMFNVIIFCVLQL